MIYVDTSAALAHLLGEDRRPPTEVWSETLVSSRLLEYELWTRIHGYGLADSHGDLVRTLIGRIALARLDPEVLSRSREPFPGRVRTLDALHLATMRFLIERGQALELLTYDERMREVATALGWQLIE